MNMYEGNLALIILQLLKCLKTELKTKKNSDDSLVIVKRYGHSDTSSMTGQD